jgi:sugar lactone lactonase YvrE
MLRLRYWSMPHLTGRLLAAISALLLMASSTMLRLTASAQPTPGQTPGGDPIVCPDGSPRQWSIFAGGPVPGHFGQTQGIALDRDSSFVVVDTWNHRILRLGPNGEELAIYGSLGSAPGQLDQPTDLDLDVDGNIYVADRANQRVQKLAPDGAPLAEWRARHVPNWPALEPLWVATGGGYLYAYYVTSHGPSQLQRIAPSGEELEPINTVGLRSVKDMAAASDGTLYVVDKIDSTIRKFSPSGDLLAIWGKGEGGSELQLRQPSALAFGPEGNLYLVDQDGRRAQAITSSGEVIGTWDLPRGVYGIVIGGNGNIYVTPGAGSPITQIAPTGEIVRSLGIPGNAPWIVRGATSLGIDPSGQLLVPRGERLQVFSATGAFIGERSFQAAAERLQERSAGRVMTMTEDGSVYIVAEDRVVVKVTPDGRVDGRWEIGRVASGPAIEGDGENVDAEGRPEPRVIMDVAVDHQGHVYLADGISLHKLASDGTRVARWAAQDVDPFALRPDRSFGRRVAVDNDENIYVASQNQVYKLTLNGELLARFGNPPAPARQPASETYLVITGLAVDRQGNIYVANDGDTYPLRMLSRDGELLALWGSGNAGPGDPFSAEPHRDTAGIAIGHDSEIFLAAGDRVLRLGCPAAN